MNTKGPADPNIEGVAIAIEQLIFDGELAPGTKLRELALAERLGLGRGPVREAIRILQGRRLLIRTPNAGVTVAKISIEDFEQLLITREALEGMAARYAAENMTLADIKELRAVAERMEQAERKESGPLNVFTQGSDNDFHRNIAIGSRNGWISQLLCDDLYSLLRLGRFHAAVLRGNPATSRAEHNAIIDRIQDRDPDGAEALMRAHVSQSRTRLLRHLRGDGEVELPQKKRKRS